MYDRDRSTNSRNDLINKIVCDQQGSAHYPTISLSTPATVQDRVFPEIMHQQT